MQYGRTSFLLLLATLTPVLASAQTEPDIDAIRDAIRENVDVESLGAAYAAIVNFAASPEITTATYNVDGEEGVTGQTLKAHRLPYRHVFNQNNQGLRPFMQVVLFLEKLKSGFEVTTEDFIDSKWRTYGLSLAGGVEIPFEELFTARVGVNAGYAKLDNRADYSGPFAESLLRPSFEDILFDWDVDAFIYGAALGLDYAQSLEKIDLEVRTGLNHNIINSLGASSSSIEFNSHLTTFDVDVTAAFPTGRTLVPVGILGNTTFIGPRRDALGFSSFYEAGMALRVDLTAQNWPIQTIYVGAKAIFGKNVNGWSLILGFSV